MKYAWAWNFYLYIIKSDAKARRENERIIGLCDFFFLFSSRPQAILHLCSHFISLSGQPLDFCDKLNKVKSFRSHSFLNGFCSCLNKGKWELSLSSFSSSLTSFHYIFGVFYGEKYKSCTNGQTRNNFCFGFLLIFHLRLMTSCIFVVRWLTCCCGEDWQMFYSFIIEKLFSSSCPHPPPHFSI